jgi:prepilin-type N-terminal cleavage/methylation domain-containing protein
MSANAKLENAPRRRSLAVDWHDCVWQARVVVCRPLPLPPLAFQCSRRKSISLKIMKTYLPPCRRNRRAFTLIELLVVIGIIAILASLIFPALAIAKKHALMMKARTQISQIDTAIRAYDSAYGRFPVSSGPPPSAQYQAGVNGNPAGRNPNGDFTYGGTFRTPTGTYTVQTAGLPLNNAEVIAILMDQTNYPGGGPTINMNHVKNPQQHIFLNAKMSGDTSSPGVGTDLVYRDPWGNPYVISMDLNYDDMCQDAFYCKAKVSQQSGAVGLNGLVGSGVGNSDDFKDRDTVMVWSAGPDGKVDPDRAANQGANKDNILGWK